MRQSLKSSCPRYPRLAAIIRKHQQPKGFFPHIWQKPAGEALLDVKRRLGDKARFLVWLEENFDGTVAEAKSLMRLAKTKKPSRSNS